MTDRARTREVRPPRPTTARAREALARRRKPSATPVVVGSLATFMGLFGFMASQLGTGHDPALSAKAAAPVPPLKKRVVVKRVEHHVVVTKLLPPREESDDDGGAPQPVPAAASAPAASAPVVVQSAPAPATAPAPAPVVTASS